MDKMDTAQAIEVAKQLRHTFRAFEHIEGLLREAAQADQKVTALAATVEELSIKRSDLEATIKNLSGQIKKAAEERDELVRNIERERTALMDEVYKEVADKKAELQSELKSITEDIESYMQRNGQLKIEAQQELDRINEEITKKRQERDDLQREIEAIKARFA